MIIDSRDDSRLAYSACQKPAESIYACYCRWMEDLNESGLLPSRSLKIFNHLPLILFDKVKSQRALEWVRGEECVDMHIPFRSCIVGDPIGVVVLEKMRVMMREDAIRTMFLDRDLKPHHSFEDMEKDCGQQIDEVLLTNFTVFVDVEDSQPRVEGVPIGVNLICTGTAAVYHANATKSRYTKFVDMICLARDEDKYVAVGGNDVMKITGNSLGTAIDQLQYLSQPGQYVVQMTPKKVRDPNKTAMMIRAHERRRILILDPEEMHKIYPKLSGGSHASPIPHLRMGHWRTFQDIRYKSKRGQRIWIEEIKVKAGEKWEVDGKTYKVMERGD